MRISYFMYIYFLCLAFTSNAQQGFGGMGGAFPGSGSGGFRSGGFNGQVGGLGLGTGINGPKVNYEDREAVKNHAYFKVANALLFGGIEPEEIFFEVDPRSVLGSDDKEAILDQIARDYNSVPISYDPKTGNLSEAKQNPMYDKIQSLRELSGLERSSEIDSMQRTLEAYNKLGDDPKKFIQYLENNLEGKLLTETVLNYSNSSKIHGSSQKDKSLLILRAALKGNVDDAIFLGLFEQYVLLQNDPKILAEMKDIFGNYTSELSNLKRGFFGGGDTIACQQAGMINSYTQRAKDSRRQNHLETFGNLDDYIEVDQVYVSPNKEDGTEWTSHEKEELRTSVKNDSISFSVDLIHRLQEFNIDLNIQCANGETPMEMLKYAYNEGLFDHLDESSLYLLGLKEDPCETLSIRKVDLKSLCDFGLLLSRIENAANSNERVSKDKGVGTVNFIYGNTEGECTIKMFDRIININERIVDREVEVYISDEKLADTNEKTLKRFFQELRKKYIQ